jgi:hypothetical protein
VIVIQSNSSNATTAEENETTTVVGQLVKSSGYKLDLISLATIFAMCWISAFAGNIFLRILLREYYNFPQISGVYLEGGFFKTLKINLKLNYIYFLKRCIIKFTMHNKIVT